MLGHAALDQRQHGLRGARQPRRRRVPPIARQPGATRGRKRGDSARRADCSGRSAAGCAGHGERHRESRWRARSARRCRSWSLRRDRAGPPASPRAPRAGAGATLTPTMPAPRTITSVFSSAHDAPRIPFDKPDAPRAIRMRPNAGFQPAAHTPLLHHAFDTLSINRVVLQADLSTPPSRRTVHPRRGAGAAWRFFPRTLKLIPHAPLTRYRAADAAAPPH